MIRVEVEGFRIPTNNQLLRGHWTVYRKLKEDLGYLIGPQLRAVPKDLRKAWPYKRARVVFTRLGTQVMDPDNLAACTKPLLDLLRPLMTSSGIYQSGPQKGKSWSRIQGCFGVIAGDTTQEIELVCRWEKAAKPGFRLEIEPLEAP